MTLPGRVEKTHTNGFSSKPREVGVIRMTTPIGKDDEGKQTGGYGFITPELKDGIRAKDVFFFHSEIPDKRMFKPGVRVAYVRQVAGRKDKSDRARDITGVIVDGAQ